MSAIFVYTVDRTENTRLHREYPLGVPASMATKWHRARPDDEALAACSARIVLNTEDRTPLGVAGGPRSDDLCGRCFR